MRTDATARELLEKLTLAAGAPGAEDEVRAIVRDTLAGTGQISYDRLGSVVCEKTGSAEEPRVLLDGHLDEVGFMVQSITDEGNLRFVALGGWWPHVLLGQRVEVVTARGKVPGVIGSTPPHFLREAERKRLLQIEDMYIDIGASSASEVAELGIRIGDSVVPATTFLELAVPGILSSKAFDNRVGIGLVCEVLLALRELDHPNTVVGVGSVQEEVGCRGAETATDVARPDVGIILEGTPADDLPGFKERQAVLSRGPQIRLYDPTAISNRRLVRLVEEVAAEGNVPVQLAVRRRGGTDARTVHLHHWGVPTVVVGVPARYIHTHVSFIHWGDYLRARDLVVALVKRLDEKTVASLTDFSG